jgi:adenylate kinase
MLTEKGESLSAVVNFGVPESVLVERMRGRASAESRADDRPETVVERLRVYREKTEPLAGFYRDRALLADVDGVGTVEQVAARIDEALTSVRRTGGRA